MARRDGEGQVIAALNVTGHAAETPIEVLTGEYLPLLLPTAGALAVRAAGGPLSACSNTLTTAE